MRSERADPDPQAEAVVVVQQVLANVFSSFESSQSLMPRRR